MAAEVASVPNEWTFEPQGVGPWRDLDVTKLFTGSFFVKMESSKTCWKHRLEIAWLSWKHLLCWYVWVNSRLESVFAALASQPRSSHTIFRWGKLTVNDSKVRHLLKVLYEFPHWHCHVWSWNISQCGRLDHPHEKYIQNWPWYPSA